MRILDIARNMLERYQRYDIMENYYGLLAYYGWAHCAVELEDERFLNKVIQRLMAYPENLDKQPVFHFESYKCGGNGKAYLLYEDKIGRITLPDDVRKKFSADVEKYAELTLQAKVEEHGIVVGPWEDRPTTLWIDVVTCVTPFMLFAGLTLDNDKYVEFGCKQCLEMYKLFLDKSNGLLHQAKGFVKGKPDAISEDHWSRGNGWGYIGLADIVANIPKTHPLYAEAEKDYIELTDALLNYQYDGVWKQEITRKDTWDESSGTGLILYSLGEGIRNGILRDNKYKIAFGLGIKRMTEKFISKEFAPLSSCPSCLCPGNGTIEDYITLRQPKNDEWHAYGSIVLALCSAYSNGITEMKFEV